MPPAIDHLIDTVREQVKRDQPQHLALFETYANEARFGREWLEKSLQKLKPGDEILEIGAGMMLLACQLKSEGYAITALEPVAEGFSHFHQLQQLVLGYAGKQGLLPDLLRMTGEELHAKDRFALIYSLNVMEHVQDIRKVLANAHTALTQGGTHRFVCPNYTFPYETHFGIPTFGSKTMTWRIMQRRIRRSTLPDPMGIWESLNWITVLKLKAICRQLSLVPHFNTRITQTYIQRAFYDPTFQARHPAVIRYTLQIMRRLGLLWIIRQLPAEVLPVIECDVRKRQTPS